MEYKEVMGSRVLEIRELKRKHNSFIDEKKVHILLTRYFQGDMSVIESIAAIYMSLIIEHIGRNFMNSNAPIEELKVVGIEGVITAIRTLDISKKRYFCYIVENGIEQSLINNFRKKGYQFYLMPNIHHYDNKLKDTNIKKMKALYETGLYFAKLVLKERKSSREIGELHGFSRQEVSTIMNEALSVFDKNLLEKVREALRKLLHGSKYIYTIYDFLDDDNKDRVMRFLNILPEETRLAMLALYPFEKVKDLDKENIAKGYGYSYKFLYERLTQIRMFYSPFLAREYIYPYSLHISHNLKTINILHSYNKIHPNIVQAGIELLEKTDKKFIFKIYDSNGNFHMSFEEIAKSLNMPETQLMKKIYGIRIMILKNINQLMAAYNNNPNEVLSFVNTLNSLCNKENEGDKKVGVST